MEIGTDGMHVKPGKPLFQPGRRLGQRIIGNIDRNIGGGVVEMVQQDSGLAA